LTTPRNGSDTTSPLIDELPSLTGGSRAVVTPFGWHVARCVDGAVACGRAAGRCEGEARVSRRFAGIGMNDDWAPVPHRPGN
jgi:hypothetical protein